MTRRPEQPPGQSVGIVETQFADLFCPERPLKFQSGAEMSPVRVAYETYGTLNEAKDNAVFICHALTGDAHAAGFYLPPDEDPEQKPGWWDGLIGSDRAIDTDRYFVICANVLGG